MKEFITGSPYTGGMLAVSNKSSARGKVTPGQAGVLAARAASIGVGGTFGVACLSNPHLQTVNTTNSASENSFGSPMTS